MPPCLTKADAACGKEAAKIAAERAKVGPAIDKKCGGIDFNVNLRPPRAANLEALVATLARLRHARRRSRSYETALRLNHDCAAESLLRSHRARGPAACCPRSRPRFRSRPPAARRPDRLTRRDPAWTASSSSSPAAPTSDTCRSRRARSARCWRCRCSSGSARPVCSPAAVVGLDRRRRRRGDAGLPRAGTDLRAGRQLAHRPRRGLRHADRRSARAGDAVDARPRVPRLSASSTS